MSSKIQEPMKSWTRYDVSWDRFMSCPSSQPQSDGLATATRSEKGAAGQFRGCAGIAEPTAVHAGLSQHPQRGGLLYTRGIADGDSGDSALRRL